MANIQKYIERVLIVLNPDGTVKAAHQQTMTRVVDDAGHPQMPDVLGHAEPLSGDALAKAFPTQAALAAQVQDMADARDHDRRQIAQAAKDKEQLVAVREMLKQVLGTL